MFSSKITLVLFLTLCFISCRERGDVAEKKTKNIDYFAIVLIVKCNNVHYKNYVYLEILKVMKILLHFKLY